MTAAWLGFVVLTTALVALATEALARAMRMLSLPTRWIWGAGLLLSLAIAVRAPLRAREVVLPGAPIEMKTLAATAAPERASGFVARIGELRASIATLAGRALGALDRATPPGVDRWIALAALAIGALALLALVVTYARFAIARGRWPMRRVGDRDVRVAPALGPAVVGVVRAEIVVPAWLLERSAAEQALVVAHEAEHLRARDPVLLAIGWLAAAAMPWNAAAWWMLARLRLAVELDCDARLLRRGVMPREYGTLLIDLAGRCAGTRVPLAGLPALAGIPSHLERRLVAMRSDRHRFTIVRAGALGALALVAILAACESRLPTAAEVQKMDVASAEKSAAPLLAKTPGDSLATYYIDGVVATAAAAHALPPERIASMMVTKERGAQARSEIRITTRDAALAGQSGASAGTNTRVIVRRTDSVSVASGALQKHTMDAALVYIDGVRSTQAAVAALAPSEIVSVEVLKGDAAARAYSDPAAANGVITITTKKGAKP